MARCSMFTHIIPRFTHCIIMLCMLFRSLVLLIFSSTLLDSTPDSYSAGALYSMEHNISFTCFFISSFLHHNTNFFSACNVRCLVVSSITYRFNSFILYFTKLEIHVYSALHSSFLPSLSNISIFKQTYSCLNPSTI